MGNSSSSGSRHQDDTVDYGALVPQGVYTGPRDWNQAIVSQSIAQRKLAPFYRPLEDYEDEWDDDQLLAARKEFPDPTAEQAETAITTSQPTSASSVHGSSKSAHGKRPVSAKEFRPEAAVYRGAVECPICFLYYPRNINHSRCCDQAICTECFVQIKRAEPTTTHLVSEPAACPYCVQENFGVVYKPPLWRSGIGSEGHSPLTPADVRSLDQPAAPTHKRRQRSYSAQSPEVVSTDQIRPDWEAKLAAVRAAVARRANRRIIMRQVGDRLIPVGIGRVHTEEGEGGEGGSGSRRRRNRNPPGELAQYLGMGGQDLEELMLMEAMRLSLIDHEEQQRKEADEKKKKEEAERAAGGQGTSSNNDDASASTSTPLPIPVSASNNLAPTSVNGLTASRSRTPEPSPPSNRPPPPFSTLNAALLTSGTASAFLGAATAAPSTDAGVPAIPMSSSDAGASSLSASAQSSSTLASGSSTLGSGTYGTLPSSPDSGNVPLLGNGISSTLDTSTKNQRATSDAASSA